MAIGASRDHFRPFFVIFGPFLDANSFRVDTPTKRRLKPRLQGEPDHSALSRSDQAVARPRLQVARAHSCKRVQTTGTSREGLDGRAGVATSFDHARGRYVVKLDSPAPGGAEEEEGS